MLSIADRDRYARYRTLNARRPTSLLFYHELFLPALLFGSIGAIAWAIRGSNGWGGIDGTIVPGMMWGILWYYVCWRKGIACHGVPLWLGLSIALGGELGYGQYVSWIQGRFNVGNEVIDIARWKGWVWFFLCGIGWAGPGGIILGWAVGGRTSLQTWIGRLAVPVVIAWLGWSLVQRYPALFFPNYDLGIYTGKLGHHLERTVYTNTQNFTVVSWWLGAMLVAVIQRDRTSRVTGAIVGCGFGFGFMAAAAWCLGYEYAPGYIDWWKVWEVNAGFFLGLLYALALLWCVRQVDRTYTANGELLSPASFHAAAWPSSRSWIVGVLFESLAIFLIVLTVYIGGEVEVSILLGLFYVVFIGWLIVKATRSLAPEVRSELRGRISITFAVFMFLFVTLHGATATLGLILELYPPDAVDQYAWPPRRVLLFLPMAVAVVVGAAYHMVRLLRAPTAATVVRGEACLPDRLVNLMTGLAAVGAVSIWPSRIGALYVILLGVGLWAFNSLNRPGIEKL